MKTVFSSNSELIHAFAHNRQSIGRAGNMSFSGGVLFSYNTAIAERVTRLDGSTAMLVNTTSYSNSTSKHQSRLRMAIPSHLKVIYIQNVSYNTQQLKPYTGSTKLDADLIVAYEHNANYLLIKASKARTKREQYQAEAFHLLNELKTYAEFFGLAYEFNSDINVLQAAAVARAEAEKLEAENRKNERIRQQAENLEKWRTGENIDAWFEVTALRIKGDVIETSRGANIPLDHAVKIWPLLKRLHTIGGTYTRGDKSIHLGHYTLDSFDGNYLRVGCHVIPFTEVLNIANQLGL